MLLGRIPKMSKLSTQYRIAMCWYTTAVSLCQLIVCFKLSCNKWGFYFTVIIWRWQWWVCECNERENSLITWLRRGNRGIIGRLELSFAPFLCPYQSIRESYWILDPSCMSQCPRGSWNSIYCYWQFYQCVLWGELNWFELKYPWWAGCCFVWQPSMTVAAVGADSYDVSKLEMR